MNIQPFSRPSGIQIPAAQTDRFSGSALSETARPVSYDRATFHTQAASASDDLSFARMLAKHITGQIMTERSPDPERIAQLRKQVADGSYCTDDMAIARAMMGR
ncbi:MAG: hypothetical protein ACLU79_08800 [Clostridium sp.]